MEKTVTQVQEWEYQPLLNRRYDDLKRWLTPEKIKMGWVLAKKKLALHSHHPSFDLALAIGVDRRTVYHWITGTHRPRQLSLVHIDAAFSRILGEDWPEQVDRVLNEKGNHL